MTSQPLVSAVQHLHVALTPHPDGGLSDAALWQAFVQQRDAAAFTAIVRRYGPLVLGVCRRVLGNEHDAEDAFQATFLVLTARADSVRRGESLAAWLHGTAYRIALKARREAGRRRAREEKARSRTPANPVHEVAWREVQAALDEEVERLPPRYRSAFALCHLEGLTHAQAAHRLGIKVGTFSSRLSRACERLRQRLAQRGIKLSALLAAGTFAASGQSAVPRSLLEATVQSGLAYGAGGPATLAGLSANVHFLVTGALKTMLASRWKMTTLLLLVLGLLGAGATILHQRGISAGEQKATPAQPTPKAQPGKKPADNDKVAYSGTVLDAEGKPVAGAKVYYHFITREEVPIPVRATTDTAGRFAFTLMRKDVPLSAEAIQSDPLRSGHLVVKADGFTFAWQPTWEEHANLTLRAARDHTLLKGRFIDLEGKPLPGLRVQALSVFAPEKGDLSGFLKALEGGASVYQALRQYLPHALTNPIIGRHVGGLLPSATTDARGGFQLRGFDKNQVVELRIDGPTIETQNLFVTTSPAGKRLTAPAVKDPIFGPGENRTLLPNDFTHPAGPGQVVLGTVLDATTKHPIPGAVVESYTLAGIPLSQNTLYHVTTDRKGHYRFSGLPRGEGNRIRVRAPKGQPYLPVVKDVPASRPLKEAVVDVELQGGVLVDVEAIDRETGKPVAGSASYFLLPDNPPEPPQRHYHNSMMATDTDGRLQFAALPRPAIVAFRANWKRYPIAPDAATINLYSLYSPSNYQAFASINPKGGGPVKVKFVLDARATVKGKLIDARGQPVAGALAGGLRHDWFWHPSRPLETAEFTALGLKPDRPRLLCFVHEEKKLAGSVVVHGTEKESLTVTLEPWAEVSGRLLDATGKPVKKARLSFTLIPRRKPGEAMSLDTGLHVTDRSVYKPSRDPVTDEQGRFHIDGLIPGLKYNLVVIDPTGARRPEEVKWEGLVFANLVLKPGEKKDFGEVKMKPIPKE